ncbi:MAG: hypothetical protein COU72_02145 [Parcubacteria group bacterium CG10_big_fil_rev_8_21_14_0_10_41_35]|nr:MAG: hypothetical protein COU72_02145 [Parcubacteria group bacterium CG10_big_fil_rev_8_21_14_0_10_41_35]PIZ81593.1 MAG: hypothetical protein COY02_01210 [Parcubacteria group bacterium CG_4_10_14_0_2_um_filter_41_6]
MDISFIGFTFDIIGKIIVSYTVIMVHRRMLYEHKIDNVVFKTMKKEQKIAMFGVVIIIIGYALQVPSHLG